MCQPKAQGGKRCRAHASGSRAAIEHAAITAGVSSSQASEVFKQLCQNSSTSDDPSMVEVKSFIQKMKICIRFDPSISPQKKSSLLKKWSAALKENLPSAATFYGWKNLAAELFRRNRSRVLAITISGAIGLTAACTNVSATAHQPTKVTSASKTLPGQMPTGYTTKDIIKTRKGTYQQITPTPESNIMQYNASIVDTDVKAKFSVQEITHAQQTLARFITEESYDSSLVDDLTQNSKNQWIEKNKDKFTQNTQADLVTSINSNFAGGVVNAYPANARPYYLTEDGKPRILQAQTSFDRVYLNSAGEMTFSASAKVVRRGTVVQGSGKEIVTGYLKYAMAKEDGQWKISGWSDTWQAQQLASD